jgi:hypothetical protein
MWEVLRLMERTPFCCFFYCPSHPDILTTVNRFWSGTQHGPWSREILGAGVEKHTGIKVDEVYGSCRLVHSTLGPNINRR